MATSTSLDLSDEETDSKGTDPWKNIDKCTVLLRIAAVLSVTILIVMLCVTFLTNDTVVHEKAICEFRGNLSGTLTISQRNRDVLVEGTLMKLPLGKHGIHVHEKGSLGNGCLDAGPHFNPMDKRHGGPTDEERHVGDWGNLDVRTEPFQVLFSDPIAMLRGQNGILGRAIVIHAGEDDLGQGDNEESKKTGNSGPRLDCCLLLSGSNSGASGSAHRSGIKH